jgi:hypothetical protein
MAKQSFKLLFKADKDLVMSVEEFLKIYFFGVPLKTRDGQEMSIETIVHYLKSAKTQLEDWLNIKLYRQLYRERKDYLLNEYRSFGFIKTTYPVVVPTKLEGFFGNSKQIVYPREWLIAKTQSDDKNNQRIINIIATSGNIQYHQIFYGLMPYGINSGSQFIPQYWEVEYETGFKKVPTDIKDFIGKLAAISIFNIMGDLILGAGVASQSLSIDGLSQSISSTSSATNAGYGARVLQYWKELNEEKKRLKNFYKDVAFSVM